MPKVAATLYTDPGCPWAYSLRPAEAHLHWRFGDQIAWNPVLIGLSETADAYAARGYKPESHAAGMPAFERRFGMPFDYPVKPRVAGTARACRAMVVVRETTPERFDEALRAIQFMHFAHGGLLDEDDDLREALGAVEGLDAAGIVARIDDPEILAAYEIDRARSRSAHGSPTHVQDRSATSDGPVRYTAPSVLFEGADGRQLEVGGFQPFEAYDTALANLDPSLERRPAPESVTEALEAFPNGLTTAEVTAVMRRSDLAERDRPGTEAELARLAAAGTVSREAVAGDAVWRLQGAAG